MTTFTYAMGTYTMAARGPYNDSIVIKKTVCPHRQHQAASHHKTDAKNSTSGNSRRLYNGGSLLRS